MNHLPRDLVTMALQKDMPTDKTWDMLNGFINHPKVRKISKDTRMNTDAKVDRIYQLITLTNVAGLLVRNYVTGF